jgi:hypothetical protein
VTYYFWRSSRPRPFLTSPCTFFAFNRHTTDPFVGLVRRRHFGSTVAFNTSSANRSRAIFRFRACDRVFCTKIPTDKGGINPALHPPHIHPLMQHPQHRHARRVFPKEHHMALRHRAAQAGFHVIGHV